MKVFSPAKINLGLEVGHRRPKDGYHYIKSILIPISFGDELEISLYDQSSQDRFSSENEIPERLGRKEFDKISEEGKLSKNLVWKVLKKTRPLRNIALAVHLKKHIPLGSGLGGGSSNAGTLLKYILENCLERENASLSLKAIFKIAVELGADVPFFIDPRPMLASGRGEILKPFSLGSGVGLLGLGGIALSTSNSYALLKRPLQGGAPPKGLYELDEISIQRALEHSDWRKLRFLQNDFEVPVFSTHEELKRVKAEFLREGADYALMSGSGSSIYALLGSRQNGEERESKKLLRIKKKMEASFPSYSFISFHF